MITLIVKVHFSVAVTIVQVDQQEWTAVKDIMVLYLVFSILSMLNTICITGYMIIEDSAMVCDFVMSATECGSAANELGMSDITVEDDGQIGVDNDPPFCYFERGSLKFNNLGTNTGPCDTRDHCLCRQNNFCAKIPCEEGKGDCDDDTECEGSLVCGHNNCINSTSTDCCASM